MKSLLPTYPILSNVKMTGFQERLLVVQRVLRDFPCLTPLNVDLTSLRGYVRFANMSFRVQLRIDCGSLQVDSALHTLLAPHASAVVRRLSLAPDSHALLLELKALVERATNSLDNSGTAPMTNTEHATVLPPRAFYERLLKDISTIGWARVRLHESLSHLDVTCIDAAQRNHVLSLTLAPGVDPVVEAALPEPFVAPAGADIVQIVQLFEQILNDFQSVWNALDDIDQRCHVLEPERPTRAQIFRRIAVDSRSSLRIELDPRSPIVAFPTVRFLGAAAVVAPMRKHLNERVHLWDASGDTLPIANIQRVLDIELPTPPKKNALADSEVECGICYTYRLDGAVPDIACDRQECAKPYHRECLVEWLRALPNTRQSFDTLMGACVYCEHPITVCTEES